MKGLASLIKLSKRKLDELRRSMVALENEKAQLEGAQAALMAELKREMQLATESAEVAQYFAGFAQKIKIRQQQLVVEISGVIRRIDALSAQIAEAFSELKKYEIALENAKKRAGEEALRKENITLDEIAGQQHRRESESQ